MTENPASVPALDKRPSVEDAARSLTGFDELAIARAFGADLSALTGTMTTRAIVFVLQRRAGLDDAAAYKAAMTLSLGECEAQFAPVVDPSSPTEAELLGEVERHPEA